jgi:hypothetical protein
MYADPRRFGKLISDQRHQRNQRQKSFDGQPTYLEVGKKRFAPRRAKQVTKAQLRKRLVIAVGSTVFFGILEFTIGGKHWNEESAFGAIFTSILFIGASIYAWSPDNGHSKADKVDPLNEK